MKTLLYTVPKVLVKAALNHELHALLYPVRVQHLKCGDVIELQAPAHGDLVHNGYTIDRLIIIDVGLIKFYFNKHFADSFCKYKGIPLFPSQYAALIKQLGYVDLETFQRREFYQQKHHYRYLLLERLS